MKTQSLAIIALIAIGCSDPGIDKDSPGSSRASAGASGVAEGCPLGEAWDADTKACVAPPCPDTDPDLGAPCPATGMQCPAQDECDEDYWCDGDLWDQDMITGRCDPAPDESE